jgi:hypothetical protein
MRWGELYSLCTIPAAPSFLLQETRMDAFFGFLANQSEAFGTFSNDKSLAYGAAAVVVGVLAWMLARWKKTAESWIDPYIERNWRVIGGHVLIGAAAGVAGYGAVVVLMAISAVAAVVWSERRAAARLKQRHTGPYPKQKRWERQFLAAALAVAVGASASIEYLARQRTQQTQLLLLLAFEGVGTQTEHLEATWSKFAANWNDVFGGVKGISIYPTVVNQKEFVAWDVERDRRGVARRVSALEPDMVLVTKVRIPEKSIQLYSRVCDIETTATRCSNVSFDWRGALDSVEHTALQGAADVLRHLRNLGNPPLSKEQHNQIAKNLLRRYDAFLHVQDPLDQALVAKVGAASNSDDIPDSDLTELLAGFDASEAISADAVKQKTTREAAMARLGVAR